MRRGMAAARASREEVEVHDFPDKRWARRSPTASTTWHGNEGWVSVGIDHDTAQFAVASIRGWWQRDGPQRYPRAEELLITADGGGSNGQSHSAVEGGAAGAGR